MDTSEWRLGMCDHILLKFLCKTGIVSLLVKTNEKILTKRLQSVYLIIDAFN